MKLGTPLTRRMIEALIRGSYARHVGGFDVGSISTLGQPSLAGPGLGASGDRPARASDSSDGATRLQSRGRSIRGAWKGV